MTHSFEHTQNRRYYEQLICVLRWLQNNSVSLGEGIGWSYSVDLPMQGVEAPGIQALHRALLYRRSCERASSKDPIHGKIWRIGRG